MKWNVLSTWCVLLLLHSLRQGSSDSCSTGIEPLISGQRYRVHDQFFSSDLPSPPESRLDGSPWCTEMPPQRPWLQVEFGYDVTIHTLQTAGASRGLLFTDDFYVISFQVQIGNSTDELHTILEPNSTVPMVFFRSSTPDTVSTDFPSTVTTRVLRIILLNWTRDELCIDVEALGCLAEPLCAGDSQLTESRQLLSLSSITASSETSDDPVEDLVDRSFFFPSAWCSTQAFSEAPYVQLNFSSDVTLSYMEARGAITGFSYVTEFQLEIFDERSGNFTQYGVTDEPTVFTTSSADLMHYTFWRPAQGSLFRFIITDGVINEAPIFGPGDFCWNIILHGCLFNGTAPPFTPPPTPPPSTTVAMETTALKETTTASRETVGTTRSPATSSVAKLVGGISAIVAGTIVMFAAVTTIMVCIFRYLGTNGEERSSVSQGEPTGSSSVAPYYEFNNSIYGENINKDSSPVPEDTSKSPPPDNTYESLPSYPTANPALTADLDTLEYAYADATVIAAKVNGGGSKVTTGFVTQNNREDESAKNDSSISADDPPKEGIPKQGSVPLTQSMADNPLYGGH